MSAQQTWPEHAMTADERRALRNELPGYAPRLVSAWDQVQAELRERQKRAQRRRAYLRLTGLILGGLAVPFVAFGLIWLIA